MPWAPTVLSVACLAVAALHLLRIAVLRADRADETAHALMGAGMAAMFSPGVDPVPRAVWVVAFAGVGLWFGAVALREGRWAGRAVHHVVGGAAMLLMLGSGHDHGADGAPTGHGVHGGSTVGLGWTSVVSVLLAGYLVWHVLRLLGHRRPEGPDAGSPAPSRTAVRPSLRTSLLSADTVLFADTLLSADTVRIAHVTMSAAMAAMLLGVV